MPGGTARCTGPVPPVQCSPSQAGPRCRASAELPIRIGRIVLDVRCMFVDNPRTPLVLGRADFLDRFVLTIDQPRRRIILEEVE